MDEIKPHPSTLEWAPEEPVTDDQLNMIARIVLNWGKIDVFLNSCLAALFPMKPAHRGRLLSAIDTRKKYTLIKSEYPRTTDEILKHFYKEMDHCFDKLKIQRDVIAHGTIMYGQDGVGAFISTKNFYELKLADLEIALDNSRYALEVCLCIYNSILGRAPQPLRDRPPVERLQ